MGEGDGNRIKVGLALAAAGLVVGVGLGWSQRLAVTPVPTSEVATVESDTVIEVHVAGWVGAPGVVELQDGAIVADAVAAAGGLRAGALTDSINLAAPLGDGEQVVVPGPDESSPGVVSTSDGVIALNRADVSELQALPGVGPVLAERIVEHRDQIGGFDRVEDLLQVPGIGESKLEAIRDLVRVP